MLTAVVFQVACNMMLCLPEGWSPLATDMTSSPILPRFIGRLYTFPRLSLQDCWWTKFDRLMKRTKTMVRQIQDGLLTVHFNSRYAYLLPQQNDNSSEERWEMASKVQVGSSRLDRFVPCVGYNPKSWHGQPLERKDGERWFYLAKLGVSSMGRSTDPCFFGPWSTQLLAQCLLNLGSGWDLVIPESRYVWDGSISPRTRGVKVCSTQALSPVSGQRSEQRASVWE